MKRALLFLCSLLLFIAPVKADSFKKPGGFVGKYWAGVLPLYETKGPNTAFICTVQVIAKTSTGYKLLGAGHCYDSHAGYAVADDIGGKLYPVTVIRASNEAYDFALFDFPTKRKYPVLPLGSDENLKVGDPVAIINFSEGLGKQYAKGFIASAALPKSNGCDEKCVGFFLTHVITAGGASGSAVFSVRTHKVIGLAIGMWTMPVGLGVEPISRLPKFLAEPESADQPLTISPADFQKSFGPDHPFDLSRLPADATFVQGGYKFQVIDGPNLADFYFEFPDFIDEDDNGVIALVSTVPPHYYLELTVLAKVAQ